MMKRNYLISLVLIISLLACSRKAFEPSVSEDLPTGVYRVLENKQDLSGDPAQGFHYLTTGNYIGSGIPIRVLEKSLGKKKMV